MLGQENCELEAILGYTVSSNQFWATQQDPVSKTNQPTKQKMYSTTNFFWSLSVLEMISIMWSKILPFYN
jgi:hypothetical protein